MSSKVISVSIPVSLSKDLDKFCTKEERSRSYCVRKSLEKFLQGQTKKKPSKK